MRYYLWVSRSVYCPKTPHHVLWSSMPKETLELNLKGIPVYSRLCVRQTSGSSVTCVKPVTNLHHLFMHGSGSCLGRKKNTRGLDGWLICTFLPPAFKSMLASSQTCHKWTCFVNGKGSRQFHYVACAWNWWHVRRKKKVKKFEKVFFFPALIFFLFL